MATKAIPDGYHSATAYLMVKGAANAIDYYKRAFGATELFRMADEKGTIGHAEIRIGDSVIMLADETPGSVCHTPRSLGGSSVGMMIYVNDVDSVFKRAVEAGQVTAPAHQPVLRRSFRNARGSVRARVDRRDARGRRAARGTETPRPAGDEVAQRRQRLSATKP